MEEWEMGVVRKIGLHYNGFANPQTIDDFIRINVCGMDYYTLNSTLAQFPFTLLGDEENRQHYYVEFLNALYFDRHRSSFEAILYY